MRRFSVIAAVPALPQLGWGAISTEGVLGVLRLGIRTDHAEMLSVTGEPVALGAGVGPVAGGAPGADATLCDTRYRFPSLR
jgi:hypothetical protein